MIKKKKDFITDILTTNKPITKTFRAEEEDKKWHSRNDSIKLIALIAGTTNLRFNLQKVFSYNGMCHLNQHRKVTGVRERHNIYILFLFFLANFVLTS